MLTIGGHENVPRRYYVQWRPGTSEIVFADYNIVNGYDVEYAGLYALNIARADIRTLHSPGPSDSFLSYEYGIHADISPDGDQIVYATCEFLPDRTVATSNGEASASDPGEYIADRLRSGGSHYYEIGVMSLEEPGVKRLTTNHYNDYFPMWSPDGRWLAFWSDPGMPPPLETWAHTHRYEALRIMPAVIGDALLADELYDDVEMYTRLWVRHLHLEIMNYFPWSARYPPVWSPDGKILVVLLVERNDMKFWLFNEGVPQRLLTNVYGAPGVYLVWASRGQLWRISGALSGVAWSPDGERLALVRMEGKDAALVTVAPSGFDAKVITRLTDEEVLGQQYWEDRPIPLIDPISWSPDGSHILFRCGNRLCVVNLAGERVGAWPFEPVNERPRFQAAWSPDGSRIAVYGEFDPGVSGQRKIERVNVGGARRLDDSAYRIVLYTMAPDGSDVRVLVRRRGRGGDLEVVGADEAEADGGVRDGAVEVVDGGAQGAGDGRPCTAGRIVAYPDAHPELVRDCETLLRLREALAGGAELHWGDGQHLMAWRGVDVDGRPPRVQELHLAGSGLSGSLPAELGELSGLTRVRLLYNELGGSIPAELGQLTNLIVLNLKGNNLTGEIPAELGQLTNLIVLNLRGNNLTGEIPAELGQLSSLKELYLRGNQLTGCIPPGLHKVPGNDLGSLGLPDCEPA